MTTARPVFKSVLSNGPPQPQSSQYCLAALVLPRGPEVQGPPSTSPCPHRQKRNLTLQPHLLRILTGTLALTPATLTSSMVVASTAGASPQPHVGVSASGNDIAPSGQRGRRQHCVAQSRCGLWHHDAGKARPHDQPVRVDLTGAQKSFDVGVLGVGQVLGLVSRWVSPNPATTSARPAVDRSCAVVPSTTPAPRTLNAAAAAHGVHPRSSRCPAPGCGR